MRAVVRLLGFLLFLAGIASLVVGAIGFWLTAGLGGMEALTRNAQAFILPLILGGLLIWAAGQCWSARPISDQSSDAPTDAPP
jgi:hypothetical protein